MDLLWSQARIWIWLWNILVLETPNPWNTGDSWTSSLLQHLLILPIHPLSSSYLLLLLSSFGMVWLWGGGGPLTFILILKSCGMGGCNLGSFSFLLHSLPLTSLFLPATPPSSWSSSFSSHPHHSTIRRVINISFVWGYLIIYICFAR